MTSRNRLARSGTTRSPPRAQNTGAPPCVLGAALPATQGRQPAALVSIVVEPDHRDRLADDEPVGRQVDIVFEGLPKRPKHLVVTVSVDGDLLDQFFEFGKLSVTPSSR